MRENALTGDRGFVRLHLNEFPFKLPDFILKEIFCAVHSVNRYPVGLYNKVISILSDYFNVGEDNIAIVDGVDDCVDHIIDIYSDYEFNILRPGFNGYQQRLESKNKYYNCLDYYNFSDDILTNYLSTIEKKKLLFVSNPHNPTGYKLDDKQINILNEIFEKVFIDNTYEFENIKHRNHKIKYNKNIIFYSFSKMFGLAGLRIGVVISETNTISKIKKNQRFCHFSNINLTAIISVLKHQQWFSQRYKEIQQTKEFVLKTLRTIGVNSSYTHTNFILICIKRYPDLKKFLFQNNILVMDVTDFGLADFIRVTIGTDNEMKYFLKMIEKYIAYEFSERKYA